MENNTLNGFEAILDNFIPRNVGGDSNDKNDIDPKDLDEFESLTDEELEALKKKSTPPVKKEKDLEDDDLDEDDEEDDEPVKPAKKNNIAKKQDLEDLEDDTHNEDDLIEDDDTQVVTSFFEALSEKMGWELDEEDEKPKTPEELIEYFQDVIEENSTPNYASDEVAALDEFVKNGGNIKDYFLIDAELDLEEVDVTESEATQKIVLKQFLKEKGFNDKQIEKRLSRYEESGVLEDEAEDALEALKEIREQKKEQLLTEQEKAATEAKKRQQAYFDSVVNEIKDMDSVRGVKIPLKDKLALLEYIFKPMSDGMTKYLKDFALNTKNLLESAYFTMKGDTLIDIAKKDGNKSAINNFKNSLNRNSGVDKRSKKEVKNSDDTTIWSSFTRQLRVA